MWKDRTDIGDGVDYISNLRRRYSGLNASLRHRPNKIDSDVLIDISRGKPAAREYIDALPEAWAISQISALELIVGARDNRDLADIDTFLSA